jgi:hypothetical protein
MYFTPFESQKNRPYPANAVLRTVFENRGATLIERSQI